MNRRLNTTYALAILLMLSADHSFASSLPLFEIPDVGKFRSCEVNEDCSQARDCTFKKECKLRDCRDIYSKKKCKMRIAGRLIDNPACLSELRYRQSRCEAERSAQKAACEAENNRFRLDCERVKSLERAQCEANTLAERLFCLAVQQEEVDASEPVVQNVVSAIKAVEKVTGISLPIDIRRIVSGAFPVDLVTTARVVETQYFDRWYSFIFSKNSYTDWKIVAVLPILRDADVLVAGNYIFLSPAQELDDVPLDAFVRALVQVSLFKALEVDGYSQIYTSDREFLVDYVDRTTDAICVTLKCYE